MRRRQQVFTLFIVALPAVCVGGLASVLLERESGAVNADTDPIIERLRVEEVADRTGVPHVRAVLEDECGGTRRDIALSQPFERVRRLEAREIDQDTRRPEILLVADSQDPQFAGIARILRYEDPEGNGCGVRSLLFSYSTNRPHPPLEGREYLAAFDVRLADYDRRRRGLEVAVREAILRRGQAPKAKARSRVTYWRLAARAGRYVRYR